MRYRIQNTEWGLKMNKRHQNLKRAEKTRKKMQEAFARICRWLMTMNIILEARKFRNYSFSFTYQKFEIPLMWYDITTAKFS